MVLRGDEQAEPEGEDLALAMHLDLLEDFDVVTNLEEVEAFELLNEGVSAYNRGKYAEAVERLGRPDGPLNLARVYTHEDRAVQTPNSDTPYSWLALDLRAEPYVLAVPEIEEGRYFSIQLIDLYTHNFSYIGSRATGNNGGTFLIVGPDWQGEFDPTTFPMIIIDDLPVDRASR